MQLKRWAGLCAALVLAGCSSMGSGPSLGGSWREVGLSQSGNMRYVNTPHFKTAVNQWQFDCQARTRRLMAVEMWDASGNKLAANQYETARLPAKPVVKGSAGGKQFEIACGKIL